jgi:hypothetical protein
MAFAQTFPNDLAILFAGDTGLRPGADRAIVPGLTKH